MNPVLIEETDAYRIVLVYPQDRASELVIEVKKDHDAMGAPRWIEEWRCPTVPKNDLTSRSLVERGSVNTFVLLEAMMRRAYEQRR